MPNDMQFHGIAISQLLLLLSRRYPSMRMRILLALGTGLRRGDIDFSNSYVTTKSKKTRKSMGSRPVQFQAHHGGPGTVSY